MGLRNREGTLRPCAVALLMVAWGAPRLGAQTPMFTLTEHQGPVLALTFSTDGTKLATGGKDGAVILWDVHAAKKLMSFKGHRGVACSLAFSRDGKRLAAGGGVGGEVDIRVDAITLQTKTQETPSKGQITIWDLAKDTEGVAIHVPRDIITALIFTLDGNSILAGGPCSGVINLWDLATRRERRSYNGLNAKVGLFSPADGAVALAPKGQSLAWGTCDGDLQVRSRANGGEWVARHAPTVAALAFSPDGSTFVSSGIGVKIWDAVTGRELAELRGHPRGVGALAFTADGATLATGSGIFKGGKYVGGDIRLWDIKTHMQLAALEGHKDGVSALAFSPDGRTLASASADGTVILWRMPAPKAGADR